MAIDVKDNSKMTNSMVKVQIGSMNISFCGIDLLKLKIGKSFYSNGERYEGQFKDWKFCGQGTIR